MANVYSGDKGIGLYNKFTVTRNDGRSEPGEKHEHCEYFVLDLTHDPHAIPAIRAYAASCRETHPELSKDLEIQANRWEITRSGKLETWNEKGNI